jgi:hypothetical protein
MELPLPPQTRYDQAARYLLLRANAALFFWLLRLTPAQLRFIVLNLTGKGDAARQCVLGTAEWTLRPVEVNLETLGAGELLEQIGVGTAPRELLALIPLLHRGGETGIIQRWSELAGAETGPRRRADLALTQIFAERVGRRDAWQDVLKGFAMIESPLIAELLADTATKAKAEAELQTAARSLLRVLQKRYRELPEELVAAVRACTDGNLLDNWLDVVGEAETLEQFRQRTKL